MTRTTHVRWSVKRDLAEVVAISEASFREGWTEVDFLAADRCRECIRMVAERGDSIVGYAVYRLRRDRIELLNLAVAPAARRSGVGAALAAKLADKVIDGRREFLAAEVDETNACALGFFRAVGLRAVGLARGEADETDAVRMELRPTAEEWAKHGLESPVNRIASYFER